MEILVTGKGGKSGSWQIRAIQLGKAIGAKIKPMADLNDCKNADLIVVVKRTPARLIETIRQSGTPWVLDLVDGWPQPCCWSESESIAWLRNTLKSLEPKGVVFGTARMQTDADYKGQSIVLPHHSWSRYADQKPVVRDEIRIVGYEGAEPYLGRWREVIERECSSRGWALQINGDMTQADIGIALRDGGGYPARHWKPGTKLSNLHALGIPALCSTESGYLSVASGAEYWIESERNVSEAFDAIEDSDRSQISHQMRNAVIRLSDVAETYKGWLESL